MNQIKWIVVAFVLLLGFIAAVQNYETLTTSVTFKLDLYFQNYETSEMPLALVAVITFLVGLVSAWLYGITERFRLNRQIKALMKDAKEKEKELKSLRNLPVTTEDMRSDQTPGP
jgi:uncharacterized integral membrane protein